MSKISHFVFAAALFAIIYVQSIDGVAVPTANQQCLNLGFSGACRIRERNLNSVVHGRCTKLVCGVRVRNKYHKQASGIPHNGTPCGHGKVCRSGRCIPTWTEITLIGEDTYISCSRLVSRPNRLTPKTTAIPEI